MWKYLDWCSGQGRHVQSRCVVSLEITNPPTGSGPIFEMGPFNVRRCGEPVAWQQVLPDETCPGTASKSRGRE